MDVNCNNTSNRRNKEEENSVILNNWLHEDEYTCTSENAIGIRFTLGVKLS